ncbi:MAG: alpha/beta fold hydrolase [Candidatus Lokiarchaeota archaeon]|nr:alpha/beta fold hydrolase [Candidatus Lokiarchaeota archaeon]
MKFEEISFVSKGEVKIVGEIVYPTKKEPPYPLIIKLHGFPGDADKILENELKLVREGFAVMAFDFRGHRESDGEFSFEGEIYDVINALNFVDGLKNIDQTRIGLFGESMGGGVAICVSAIDSRPKAVCVRAPVFDTEYLFIKKFATWFKPVINMMRSDPIFKLEVKGIEKDEIFKNVKDEARKFNPIKEISKLKIPIAIIAGTKDELMQISKIKNLFELANEPKEFIEIKEADHNLTNFIAYEKVGEALFDFFKSKL